MARLMSRKGMITSVIIGGALGYVLARFHLPSTSCGLMSLCSLLPLGITVLGILGVLLCFGNENKT